MTELFRTRDVVVLFRGDSYAVPLSSALLTNGWRGGQGVMWADSTKDEFLITASNGLYGGFLLWGHDESSDQYIAYFRNQIIAGSGVIGLGGWLITTSTYEVYTYSSRLGGGPLVPIVYQEGMRLRFSNRGWFTIEDEWYIDNPLTSNQFFIGSVTQAPKSSNNNYLGVQTSL